MRLDDILTWQEENSQLRQFVIKRECDENSNKLPLGGSAFLYEKAKGDKPNKSLIIPLSLLDKIDDLNDFEKNKQIINKFMSMKRIPNWMYLKEQDKMTFKECSTYINTTCVANIFGSCKKEPYGDFFTEKLKEFLNTITKNFKIEDIQSNNKEKYDEFYKLLDTLLLELRKHLIDNYNYIN